MLDALDAYEAALMSDDIAAMDALFAPGDATLRGDAGGVLVGHETIGAFRRSRGGAPARTVRAVHVHPAGDDAAVAVTIFEARTGGRGQQTQLWRRGTDGAWRVEVAHVSSPPATYDRRVWRIVGDPLVEPTGTGPLDGETVAVKDLYAIRGYATGAGVPAYQADQPPARDHAPAVARLLAAGAAVAGIARTDQFAYSVAGLNDPTGAPPNAAVPGAVPGGSSSGSASAVALGAATLGLATDTAGSIRVPASYQGLWGLRPTHGSVDATGVVPLAPSFDTVGVLARTADRVVRAAAVLREEGAPDRTADGPIVVAPQLLAVCEPAVAGAFAVWVSAAGGVVEEVRLPDVDAMYEAFRVRQAYEAWQAHGAWIEAHPGAVTGAVADRFAAASRVTVEEDAAALEALGVYATELDAVLAERLLALPAASSPAPTLWADPTDVDRTRAATLKIGAIAGITGRPAVAAPLLHVAGDTTRHAPVGVSLVGPRDSDLALVRRAASFA
ncbi:UNVERIFIED_CONTAM: hypothetical protein LK11_32680 [Mumia flava]